MKGGLLFIILIVLAAQDALAQCGSCTVTVTPSTNTNANITLSAGQNLCIQGGATFTGQINGVSSTSTICVTGNSTFNGHIYSSIPATAQVYIESGSTFNANNYYGSNSSSGGYFINYGTLTFPLMNATKADFRIDNYGTVTFSSGVQPASSTTSTFNNYSGGTISFVYYNNSNTTSCIVNINNAGTITSSGTLGFGNNSTFTNSGNATISGQFNFAGTGCALNNSGTFTANGLSTFANNSTLTNSNSTYIDNLTLSGTSSFTNTADGVLTFGAHQISLPDGSSSSITNNGTLNFQIGLQLGTNTTLTNNNDIQMDNSGSTLVNNGNYYNYGYIYVNGTFTSNSTSNSYNYCTLVTTSGISLQGNSNNSGYMLVPTNGTSANGGSPLFLVNGGTFTNNGWVQGTNYKNTSAVTGHGNFYFTGNTDVENNFSGTSSSQTMNFYDTSRNPIQTGSTGYNYFDQGWGTVSNTVRTAISPVSINIRPSTCSASVLSAGSNSECSSIGTGYNTSASNLLLNGSFTSPVTTSVITSSPGTYNSGAATTYSFSGGSFKSQADYNGTTCAKAYSNGNAFALVNATPSTPYTGSGNCSNDNQKYFPGDATYGVAAADTMMAITANYVSGSEFLAYQQTVTGLTANTYYTFYFYISNMREPSNSNSTDEPYIRVRVGGTDGKPDGTLYFGPYTFDETTTQNSASLNGWVRVAVTFKATSSSAYIKITDGAYKSSNGDDWAITAMGLNVCASCQPTIAVNCNTATIPQSVQLYESSGLGQSWYWTTTSGGRFYTSSAYSTQDDSDVSHLDAPYIKFYGDYSLQITTSTGCTGTSTLTVTDACGSVLATGIMKFTAAVKGGAALLNWTTAQQVNADYFDIERSSNGANWAAIGKTKAFTTGTQQNYTYTDDAPLNGINYYRLKQVNTDGNYYYSQVSIVKFTPTGILKVYPNPASSYLTVSLSNDKNEAAYISVFDASGRLLYSKQEQLTTGANTIRINLPGNMVNGTYLLKISTGSNTYTSKFLKALQ
ncbi:MAG TPA: T9SS type A sorting domain-containing protein [Chitinophagaceae bacterium]|nr:T9SS type A sorting domain-containing protein [Chitinophagaceae bacterium]